MIRPNLFYLLDQADIKYKPGESLMCTLTLDLWNDFLRALL